MAFRKLSGVLIAPMALVLVGCTVKAANDPRTQPQLVRTTAVAASSESTRSFTGVVTARVQSDLGFRVPGKVTKRLVGRPSCTDRTTADADRYYGLRARHHDAG